MSSKSEAKWRFISIIMLIILAMLMFVLVKTS